MRITRLLCVLLIAGCGHYRTAAQGALISGRIIDRASGTPVADVFVELPRARALTRTDAEGRYAFASVTFGYHTVICGTDSLRILADTTIVRLPDLAIAPVSDATPESAAPDAGTGDGALLLTDDDGSARVQIPGVLHGSRDPLSTTQAYSFSAFRFQPRGYDRQAQQLFINGARQVDPESGSPGFGSWSGLNDMFRTRESTQGQGHSDYGPGGIHGLQYFDVTAAAQRAGTRITYSNSNRSYRNRFAISRNSGLVGGKWYWSAAFSRRSGRRGQVQGTFYDGWSAFAAVSRKLGVRHSLHLTAFGATLLRGKSSPLTAEVVEITGSTRYNPSWGLQQGSVRNARTSGSVEPQVILQHVYAHADRTRVVTAAHVLWSRSANTALDWFHGRDPRPDYYRNMPSWLQASGGTARPEDAVFLRERQIDWDRLYAVNAANLETHTESGLPVTGKRSVYVLSADVTKLRRSGFSTRVEHVANRFVTIQAGGDVLMQSATRLRQLVDLLGGDYFLNLNQFAEQQTAGSAQLQFDLLRPDRLIREGDAYNYDHITRSFRACGWAQVQVTFSHLDLFLSSSYGQVRFSRQGLYQHGIFQANSLGRSPSYAFAEKSAKGGMIWKVNGRHYVFVHGRWAVDAPQFNDLFLSARTRNDVVDQAGGPRSVGMEAGYLLRAPKFNGRFVAFSSRFTNGTEIRRFYNDDPVYRTFVNYVLRGTAATHQGLEAALEVKVTSSLSVTGVAVLYEALHASNPIVSVYVDNDTVAAAEPKTVYLSGHHLATGPQRAYSLNGFYRGRQYWNAGLSLNYGERNFMDINPDRRSEKSAALLDPQSPEYAAIFSQQRLPSAFTIDVSFFKSLRLSRYLKGIPRQTTLYLSLGINNLLDSRFATGAFEQLRFDFAGRDPDRFPPKYFFHTGRTYFFNASISL